MQKGGVLESQTGDKPETEPREVASRKIKLREKKEWKKMKNETETSIENRVHDDKGLTYEDVAHISEVMGECTRWFVPYDFQDATSHWDTWVKIK